ncbi:hypothetical protein B0H14DRAFT_3059963, partial [Mycena olivaceomarginata]
MLFRPISFALLALSLVHASPNPLPANGILPSTIDCDAQGTCRSQITSVASPKPGRHLFPAPLLSKSLSDRRPPPAGNSASGSAPRSARTSTSSRTSELDSGSPSTKLTTTSSPSMAGLTPPSSQSSPRARASSRSSFRTPTLCGRPSSTGPARSSAALYCAGRAEACASAGHLR